MPLVSQMIENLLNGVSQQPSNLRLSSQADEQVNGLSRYSDGGPSKRPGTLHVDQLTSSPSAFTSAYVHPLNFSSDERYFVILVDGDLKVYDKSTGSEQTVLFPHGKGYLDLSALTGSKAFRAVTVGRRTFISNKEITVERDSTRKAPVQDPQAIIYLEQADFATTYSVTIDGIQVSYDTPAGTDAAARAGIGSDRITAALLTLLDNAISGFTFEQFGSMIRVRKDDGGEFSISAADGLADNGLRVIKNTVQRTTDLPLRCIDGYVLEVVNGPEEAKDTYWVKFDSQGSDDYRGVWVECARPGEGIAFDHSTLPHELTYSDELSPEMEARGFPAKPVVLNASPTKQAHDWQLTQDGSVVGNQFVFLRNHDSKAYVNLTQANGGPVQLEVRYTVSTTQMTADQQLFLTCAINDSATGGAGTFTDVATLVFSPGLYLTDQRWLIDIGSDVPANYDVRLTVTYSGGSTPADTGVVALHPHSGNPPGFQYTTYAGKDVTWRTTTVYPKGTVWTITVGGDDAAYTQTDDQTGAEIAAALDPLVEALTGVASEVATNATGTAVRITLDAGGLPTVTVSGVFDDTTQFWNPDLDLGFDGSDLDGKTLRNLSDGCEGTITDCYAHGITVSSLSGGVDNAIRAGDLCVVVDATVGFTFKQVNWTDRKAGDSVTNPWPSLRDDTVVDVFFHRGRLGLLSAGNVVLAEANKPENLFRTATTNLLDADPIDAKPASSGSVSFHSAAEWDSKVLLFTDTAQYELQGEPLLTPATVALPQITRFSSSPIRPLTLGTRLYFARGMGRYTRVFEYQRQANTDRPDAVNITRDIPSYLVGDPVLLVGDFALGFFAVLTDDDPSKLFVYSFHYEDDKQFQAAWSRWEFAPGSTIIGLDIVDGTLVLVFKRSDGVYLETLDLDEVA